MRQEAKRYFLKEYGSWSVLITAYITGLCVSRTEISWKAFPLFLALGFLINSKQAFTITTGRKGDARSLLILLSQIIAATAILLVLFGTDIPRLLPLLVFPAAYLLMNRLAGEHYLLTEIIGFALISISAVLGKFLLTGGVDVRLFLAVALYFTAGVFKVKAMLRKRVQDRLLTALYVIFAVVIYHGFHIYLVILLPLVDNLVVAARPYQVKLQTTGWIEVAKSLLFLGLMIAFY